MNILKSLSRSPLGLDLYLWLTYRTFTLKRPLRLTWPHLYRQFGVDPAKAGDARTVDAFRTDCLRELKKIKTPGWTYTTRRSRARWFAAGDRAVAVCDSWNSASKESRSWQSTEKYLLRSGTLRRSCLGLFVRLNRGTREA